jgi:hypothetical protein
LRNSFAQLLALLDHKIGRCPRCMKSAFISAAASWFLCIVAFCVWQENHALALLILAPLALTGLWLAHVAAYGGRVFAALRAEYIPTPARSGPTGGVPTSSRRDFFWMIATAAAITVSATVWLPTTSHALGHECGTGKYCPDDAPNCCSRSQGKCCNGNWACTVNGKCYAAHEDARAACGSGTVWACS